MDTAIDSIRFMDSGVQAGAEHAYLTRQALLDRQLKVVGYRFDAVGAAGKSAGFGAAAGSLVAHACGAGGEWALRERLAVIPAAAVPEQLPDLLPGKRVVIEFQPDVAISAETARSFAAARGRGYTFALSGPPAGPNAGRLLEMVDLLLLDVGGERLARARDIVRAVEKHRAGIQAVARGAESLEQVEECRRAGFTHFLAPRLGRATPGQQRNVNPSHALVLELLNKVGKNAELKEIEAAFKRDAALSFKVLRYINSVGFGLSCQIQSIRHALSILGYKQLYRWLTLLLVTAGDGDTPPVTMKSAVTRGRLVELLGQNMVDCAEADNLFMVGVFSMLDSILQQPMEELLNKLNLPESVNDALLGRQGIYGPFLRLAEACEGCAPSKLPEVAGWVSLDAAQVNRAHLHALAWVEQLGV